MTSIFTKTSGMNMKENVSTLQSSHADALNLHHNVTPFNLGAQLKHN
jgi:hypothetical protein